MPRGPGQAGERAAERELRRRGMTLLERNARAGGGELDLVALDRDTIVFVEVKARGPRSRGTPEEAVNRRKRARLVRAARAFLAARGLAGRRIRYDVATVRLDEGGHPGPVRWIEAAFDEGEAR